MRRVLLLCVCSVLFLGLWANPIGKDAAYQQATAFMKGRGVLMQKTPLMAFAKSGRKSAPGNSLYYVFNVGNDNGFVIVAGDDAVSPILGYTDNGNYNSEQLPENAKAMLDSYADQIEAIRQNPSLLAATASSHEAIAPLVQTKWNQEAPYNYMCPTVVGEKQRSVTGCVATAMAQIMYYHQWPVGAAKAIPGYSYQYSVWKNEVVKGEPSTTFNWDVMKTTYTGSETENDVSAKAVAELMVYAGKSVEMNYSYNYGSGAYSYNILPALKNYFDYDSAVRLIERSNYSSDEWEQLIYDEIANKRPVIIGASAISQTGESGHEFVCDGYDGSGLYHINWGWSGYSDGYFRLALLNPDGEGIGGTEGSGGYSLTQEAVIGIQPNQGNNDTIPVVLSTYALDTKSKTGTRASVSEEFSLLINLETYNMTGSASTFDIAVGIFDSNANLVDTAILEEACELDDYTGIGGNAERMTFGKGLSDGVYYLKTVSRLTGETEWQLQNNANLYYIAATVKGNTVSYENISQNSELTINEVTLAGNNRATSVQKIYVNLTNTGTAYTNELYLYVNGSKMSGMGINIDPGTSADYTFNWTPSKTGDFIIKLTDDSNGKSVLYSDTVAIKNSIVSNLSAAFQVENATGKVIAGNTIKGTVTVTNKALAQYYDNVYISAWYDGKDNYMYKAAESAQFIQLTKGESTDLSFNFTDLDVSRDYILILQYNNLGTLDYTEDTSSDWYSLDNTSGVESVEVETNDVEQPIYNLNGVRMPNGSSLPKGIYIQGGKKIVVK